MNGNKNLKEFARWFLPGRPRCYRILRGPLRGERMVVPLKDYPAAILGYAERSLLEWIRKNVEVGSTWIDVGAHYGLTSLAMCRATGPGGRVFAFEPGVATAGCVARTQRENRLGQLTVCPFALGDSEGLALLRLPCVRGMIDGSVDTSAESPEETFFSVGFDAVWASACGGMGRIDGVKIDVQGAEIDVLKGMETALSQQRPKIVLEIHENVSRDAVLSILETAGYAPTPIPIEPDPIPFERIDGNQSYLFLPK